VLSVVIASARSARDLAMSLNALSGQTGEGIEIIVADGSGDQALKALMAKYPRVKFMPLPAGTGLPDLLGAGISRTTGDIIALTDTTCVVGGEWVSAILDAHRSEHLVIGGAVESSEAKGLTDWAAFFCEYGQFLRPLKEGAVNELPGNNISFKRSALTIGREFTERGFWKTYWCRGLMAEGVKLISNPTMVIYDHKNYRLIPFLTRRFHHGRCFAGMRVAQISNLRRVTYFFGSPLLPFVFFARTVKPVFLKRRHLKKFLLSLPICVLAILFWSAGEFWGYATGPGQSCAHVR
jgi:glycosyltransferase involved in cell wall biosynthesis